MHVRVLTNISHNLCSILYRRYTHVHILTKHMYSPLLDCQPIVYYSFRNTSKLVMVLIYCYFLWVVCMLNYALFVGIHCVAVISVAMVLCKDCHMSNNNHL